MSDFQWCIAHILKEEGGHVNHPNDPGGETKFGISKRAYPHVNIGALTEEAAKDIYFRDYWIPIRGEELPIGLDVLMLDCAVNQGVTTAARLLQKVCGVTQDSVIGPVTIAAAKHAMPDVLTLFAAERALRYEMSSNEAVFGRGWYRRLLKTHHLAMMAATAHVATH